MKSFYKLSVLFLFALLCLSTPLIQAEDDHDHDHDHDFNSTDTGNMTMSDSMEDDDGTREIDTDESAAFKFHSLTSVAAMATAAAVLFP